MPFFIFPHYKSMPTVIYHINQSSYPIGIKKTLLIFAPAYRRNKTHAKAKKTGSSKLRSKFETLRREIKADVKQHHNLNVNNLVADIKADLSRSQVLHCFYNLYNHYYIFERLKMKNTKLLSLRHFFFSSIKIISDSHGNPSKNPRGATLA